MCVCVCVCVELLSLCCGGEDEATLGRLGGRGRELGG